MLFSLLSLALLAAPASQSPPVEATPAQLAPAQSTLVQAPSVPSEFMGPIDPLVWTTPGGLIPDLELPRVDGEGLVRLSDYEGKKLLLIHFASW